MTAKKWGNAFVQVNCCAQRRPDIAATFTDTLQRLDISKCFDFFHLIHQPLRPGMIKLGRLIEERLLVVVELHVIDAVVCNP